jgi:hypothetical protein
MKRRTKYFILCKEAEGEALCVIYGTYSATTDDNYKAQRLYLLNKSLSVTHT